ncbi:hypothetical protein IRJ34_07210 [Paenarthrobacter sp. GOM3]|uniref:hypothetical protein n=1 Tax=Paenarthrobacter sp. GOM3 TaxID=2782567 RepID=UPI001BA61C84|nr:hypothetical protein [Paenarthrobacter sp. GOM3]WOH20104.1 hypothetical protein IRJ34_07210 [Paenarthrobacter sp. GOM3]
MSNNLDATPIYRITEEILGERLRQHAKWGEQNHSNGTGPNEVPLIGLWYRADASDPLEDFDAKDIATAAKASTDHAAKQGTLTYADIFLEEVFEALAEGDPEKLRTELIQCAAVATAWIEKIARDAEKAARNA